MSVGGLAQMLSRMHVHDRVQLLQLLQSIHLKGDPLPVTALKIDPRPIREKPRCARNTRLDGDRRRTAAIVLSIFPLPSDHLRGRGGIHKSHRCCDITF